MLANDFLLFRQVCAAELIIFNEGVNWTETPQNLIATFILTSKIYCFTFSTDSLTIYKCDYAWRKLVKQF